MDKSEKNGPEMKEIRADEGHEAPLRVGDDAWAEGDFGARGLVLSFVVIAVAAAARFLFIGRYEVWLDEAYCFAVARKPLAAIVKDLVFDNGPPLYYVMLHFWMRFFGECAVALRSLSALFSTGSVAVIVFWRTPWLSRRARLLAGFVMAITPLSVYYAQETRMYAAVLFFTTVATVFLERGLRLGKARNWAFFSLFTALGLYTSYIAIFLVPLGWLVIVIAYLAERDSAAFKRRVLGLLAAHVAAGLLFAFWLPTFSKQPSEAATKWIRAGWEKENKALLPLKSLSVMTVGGAYYPRYLRYLRMDVEHVERVRAGLAQGYLEGRALEVVSRIRPALPYVLVGLLTAVMLWMALEAGWGGFPARSFLVFWLALPIAGPLVLSFFLRPMYVVGRYELTGLGALAVLSGLGLARLGSRLRIVVATAAALCFVYTSVYMQESFTNPGDASRKGEAVAGIATEGDVVLAEAFEYAPVYYYSGEKRDSVTFMTFPRETIKHAAWIDREKWVEKLDSVVMPKLALHEEAQATVREAAGALAVGGRLIIVRHSGPPEWAKVMDEALARALGAVTEVELVGDLAASRPQDGIVVMRRLR